MSEERRRIFSSLGRRRGLSIIPEECESSRSEKNSHFGTDEKVVRPYRFPAHQIHFPLTPKQQSHPRSPSLSSITQSPKFGLAQRSHSARRQPVDSETRALGGCVAASICLQQSTGLQPTAAPEFSGAPSAMPVRQNSNPLKRGFHRALTTLGRRKPKAEKAVEEGKEKKKNKVMAVQVDCGSTFNLSSIVKSAHQSSETQEIDGFLQLAAIADRIPRQSALDAKRSSIAVSSIIDLSGADWDTARFYAGDLASEEIYRMDREQPVVNAEPESSCGFFGSYDGSRTAGQRRTGRPARYWGAGGNRKRMETGFLPDVPSRSPLRDTHPAPALTESRTGSPLEQDTVGYSPDPSRADQEEPPATPVTTSDEISDDISEDIDAGWTVNFLERARVLIKPDADFEISNGGCPEEQQDSD